MVFYIFLLIGAFSGFLAGLLGLGGGVVVVPALATVFIQYHVITPDQLMQMAIGTSLSAIIVTFTVSLYAHAKRGSVRWEFVKRLLPLLIFGVIIGALIAHHLPSNYLRIFFCIFLIAIALKLLLPDKKEKIIEAEEVKIEEKIKKVSVLPSRFYLIVIPVLVGILSSCLGVGGGLILIPFLLSCRLPMREAMGTSVACGLGIGIIATASFMLLGGAQVDLPWSTGYIYWPAFLGIAMTSVIFAPLGTAVAYRLPTQILQRILAVFLLLVAVKMLFTS